MSQKVSPLWLWILESQPALVLHAILDFVGFLNPGFGYLSYCYLIFYKYMYYFVLGGRGLVSFDFQNVSGIY